LGLATDAAPTFEEVAQTYYPRLVRRLLLIVRDPYEAEDLAQETLLRAYRSWTTLHMDTLGAWLYTVATRLALSEIRRRRRWFWRELQEADAILYDTSDPDLWAALGALDRRSRGALILSVLEGYKQDEIADLLRVPPGTVASLLSRAKSRLREILQEEGTT
jgi:RNA polymerase sigma factor, sigma-70 family